MVTCFYKKTFLKDLSHLPIKYRETIEDLVFHEIPESESLNSLNDIRKIKGTSSRYRIRVGQYRIGCALRNDGSVVFCRVKSREEIYSVFP